MKIVEASNQLVEVVMGLPHREPLLRRLIWKKGSFIVTLRLPGHDPHRDLVMIPIEIVSARDPFLLRARESYNIWKFRTEKGMGVLDIEHGLNLDPGQQ